MTTTRVPAAQRRTDLTEAAIRVIVREGVHGATTRRIATEAGCSLAAVHYAFHSKQELLQAVLKQIIDELLVGARRGIAEGIDVRTALNASLHAMWGVIAASPERQLLTYELTTYALRHPEVADFATFQYETNDAAAREELELVAAAAGITWSIPMPELSRMFVNVVDGVVLHWLVDRDDQAALASFDRFADVLAAVAEPLPRRRKRS